MLEHNSKQLFFNNAFQNGCRFRDILGQIFTVLAPKIPFYVTYGLNHGMIRLRLTRAPVPLLKLIKLLIGKMICLKDF